MREPSEKTLKNFEFWWENSGQKLIGTPEDIARTAYINGHAHAFDEGYQKRYWYERELENKAKAAMEEKHRRGKPRGLMKTIHYRSDYGSIHLVGEPLETVANEWDGVIPMPIEEGWEKLCESIYEQTGEFRELYLIDKQTLDAFLTHYNRTD